MLYHLLWHIQGAQSLRSGNSVLDAVVGATIVLEDSPLTNAGYGSNLTLDGTVECDASVMDGSSLQFGAVGAVSGIKNPVLLAKRLCEQQSIKFAYGRIPPRYMFRPNFLQHELTIIPHL